MQYVNGCFFAPTYPRMYIQKMDSKTMTLGDRLDLAMGAAKFESQSALARASGVPQATISRILKGAGKKGPETDTVKKLAKACRVPFLWLNEGDTHIGTIRGDQTLHSTQPENTNELNEIIELINLYKSADIMDRRYIMRAARLRGDKRKGQFTRSEN